LDKHKNFKLGIDNLTLPHIPKVKGRSVHDILPGARGTSERAHDPMLIEYRTRHNIPTAQAVMKERLGIYHAKEHGYLECVMHDIDASMVSDSHMVNFFAPTPAPEIEEMLPVVQQYT
jgi:hypothetical protein